MEEGIRARPQVKVRLARPRQGKNGGGDPRQTPHKGGFSKAQRGHTGKKRRRGPRPKSNWGRTGRGHPRTNGWGGGRSDRPKGGKGRARPPQEKRRRGQRPNSNARTSWRNHPRQKWRRKPGQAQRKGWDTTGTPAEEEERRRGKTQKGLPRSRGPFWRRRGRPKWLQKVCAGRPNRPPG